MREAISDRFHVILVEGVLRMDEARIIKEKLPKHLGVPLTVIDATDLFLSRLKGVSDPEMKREITFIKVFQEKAKEAAVNAAGSPQAGDNEWFARDALS